MVLVGVVAESQTVPRLDSSGIGLLHARQQLEQGGLARAVETQDHHLAAPVDREVHSGEHLERSITFREHRRGQRCPPTRCRRGEPDLRDLVGHANLIEFADHPLGAAHHLVCRGGLRRLRAELRGLRLERSRLLLRVGALATATLLVGRARREVALPIHVVDVHRAAYRVEEPHLGDDRVE